MKLRSLLLASTLVLLPAGTTGCPSLISALPAVTSAIVEAANVVQIISEWVGAWFRAHPDPDAEKNVQAVLAKVRSAMNVVLRLAEAKTSADDGEVTRAFDALEAAYRDLLELTQPMGVMAIAPSAAGQAGGEVRMGAAASGRVLEVPATLRRPR